LEETKEVVEGLRSLASQGTEGDLAISSHLRRVMREKDEGASRSWQAMRQQTWYVYRDLEHQRAQIAKLTRDSAKAASQAAAEAADAVRRSVHQSRSWRLTRPLRAFSRLIGKGE
jgi:hypothetical protein